jgi:hypothetical protein
MCGSLFESLIRASLKDFQHHQHNDYQKNQAQSATGVRPPTSAVRPSRNNSNQQEHKNYQKNCHGPTPHRLVNGRGRATTGGAVFPGLHFALYCDESVRALVGFACRFLSIYAWLRGSSSTFINFLRGSIEFVIRHCRVCCRTLPFNSSTAACTCEGLG